MNRSATQHLIIRISKDSLSFAMDCGDEEGICFEPYAMKSGISIAANLREAFKTSDLLSRAGSKATVLVDSPTLIMPLEDFQEDEVEEQYAMTYPSLKGMSVETCVLPAFRNMVAFAVEKDVKTVLCDNFEKVKLRSLMISVWEFLQRRNGAANNKKLYAYFHDGKIDICSFHRNRFTFANTFDADNIQNEMYYILGAWKLIGAKAANDDLFMCGKIDNREQLTAELKNFLARVFYINPSADFNRAPATQIMNFPLDTMLQFV